jgi:hypothetical protein
LSGFELWEKLFFLLPDVVLHHLAKDSHLGVVQFLADFHRFNFADQVLHRRMFDDRFVDQIIVVGRVAGLRVKNLFFNLRVDLQGQADLLCELPLSIIIFL